MSPIRVTCLRTIGALRNQGSAIFALVLFWSASAAWFIFNLRAAEGGRLLLPVIWTATVSPLLPVLTAVLGMEVWSGERASGRIDSLLSIAVRERDLVLGKFLGLLAVVGFAVLVSICSSLVVMAVLAPETLSGVNLASVLSALLAIMVQATLWCAVVNAVSAIFKHAALAAVAGVVLLTVLPRAIWRGVMVWSAAGRLQLGDFPIDAHALDWSSGTWSLTTVGAYLALAALALLFTTKRITALRLIGRGAKTLKWSTATVGLLTLVLAVMVVLLANRHELAIELPVGGRAALSSRTLSVLAETSGDIVITTLLPRSDVRFRVVNQLLRQFRRTSASIGGGRIELRHVDPHWDLGAAERLLRRGIEGDSVVFECGRRQTVLALGEGLSERQCATAIERISSPTKARTIYWTIGHGETRPDDYGAFGMSDFARELARSGYRNATLDVAAGAALPSDVSMLVVAGAKQDFSRAEVSRLEAYLLGGGRLLTLINSPQAGGVVSLLPAWGIRPAALPHTGLETLSGDDVLARDFAAHAITAALQGSQVVLESPVALTPSAVSAAGVGADRITFSPLVSVQGTAVAAVAERGSAVGNDLALRPTRIVVVGDATMAMNGPLASRQNANRDFLLNCIAYLSGLDSVGGEGTQSGLFKFGLNRTRQLYLLGSLAGGVPLAIGFILFAMAIHRRHRS